MVRPATLADVPRIVEMSHRFARLTPYARFITVNSEKVAELATALLSVEHGTVLVAEKDANLTRLGVLSNNGTVYLSGTVESADQGAQAETLARGVRGVKRVVNTLQVRSAPK